MEALFNDNTKSDDATLVHTRYEYNLTHTTSDNAKSDDLTSTQTP